MDEKNICRFIPEVSDKERLHAINLVLETQKQNFKELRSSSLYVMYYVKQGLGALHVSGEIKPLKKGDVFFTFPATPFAIESIEDFEYYYASYLGTRGNQLCESMKINRYNCVFSGFEASEAMWGDAVKTPSQAMALRVESIILYTFSLLAEKILPQDKTSGSDDTVLIIKKYIDDHLSDRELTLKKISAELSYNEKYVSALFKKKMSIGISEYVNTVRVQRACRLMGQGFTSIKDISATCGFSDALYFSKVFKKIMMCSPSEHLDAISKKDEQ